MPFNGSGGFTRVRNWVADAGSAIKVRADLHDDEDNNLAAGLSNVICKDGQTAITADIPLNNHKLTGLANPVSPQDAATKASSVAKAGDTMTGLLLLSGDPAVALGAATKQYVDGKFFSNFIDRYYSGGGPYTWTKPAGLKFLEVDGCGPGGSGGCALAVAAGQGSLGGSGGSGSNGRKIYDAASLPATLTITLGAPGAGTSTGAGIAGGTTTISGTGISLTLPGGLGGTQGSNTTGVANTAGGGISSAPAGGWDWTVAGDQGGGATVSVTANMGWVGPSGAGRFGGASPFAAAQRGGGTGGSGYGAGSGGSFCVNGALISSQLAAPSFVHFREIY